jgi:hypothetical protein
LQILGLIASSHHQNHAAIAVWQRTHAATQLHPIHPREQPVKDYEWIGLLLIGFPGIFGVGTGGDVVAAPT